MRLAIIGATGSIGTQALDVASEHPERFTVVALAAGSESERFSTLRSAHPHAHAITGGSREDLVALVEASAPDLVLVASTGLVALPATLAALRGGAAVAIANKETIVAGGELVIAAAREAAARVGTSVLERLRPVDSEHSALWQCLAGEDPSSVATLWLTASGGPFRERGAAEIAMATAEEALAHPTWTMGAKITIDSASLVNKGLEVIEAHRLFAVPMAQIHIAIHPQSVVHGLVEFTGGSTKAQLGVPDMRSPIAYAMGYPERMTTRVRSVNLLERGTLSFDAPDLVRFPGLRLALEAGRRGQAATGTLIAADDVAVTRFLAGEMRFGGIPALIEAALTQFAHAASPRDAADVLALDEEVRTFARSWRPSAALARGTHA